MKDRFIFRAWDKQNKFMTNNIHTCGLCIDDFFTDENIELMQCTGLKDKNGKLEYQGDILLTPDERICFIVNDGFRWAVESPGSQAVDYEDEKFFNQCEVIGNIYENPELMEEQC